MALTTLFHTHKQALVTHHVTPKINTNSCRYKHTHHTYTSIFTQTQVLSVYSWDKQLLNTSHPPSSSTCIPIHTHCPYKPNKHNIINQVHPTHRNLTPIGSNIAVVTFLQVTLRCLFVPRTTHVNYDPTRQLHIAWDAPTNASPLHRSKLLSI